MGRNKNKLRVICHKRKKLNQPHQEKTKLR